jgi:hypothetical protein
MSISDKRRTGRSCTGITECGMGYEPGSAMSSGKLLPIRVPTRPSFDAMGSFCHILHLSRVHGKFPSHLSSQLIKLTMSERRSVLRPEWSNQQAIPEPTILPARH